MNKYTPLILLLICCNFFSCASSQGVVKDVRDLMSSRNAVVKHSISLGVSTLIHLRCNSPYIVNRTNYQIACDTKQIIDGVEFFISGKCVEIGNQEILSVPAGLILFDPNDKILSHKDGSYHPLSYSSKIRFGSRQKHVYSCTHSKIFYICEEELTLPAGNGLLLPQDCIIINKSGDVIEHDGWYYSKKGVSEQIKIACTRSKDVEVFLVPVVELPDDYVLTFRNGGKIINGIIVCNALLIEAHNETIFENIVLVGSIKNKALTVEWFGCNAQCDGQKNKEFLERYVMPSAIACKADVFHSSKGVYRITGNYPVHNDLWGFDHSCIKNFKGITIYGTGASTVIQSCLQKKDNPSDVFLIVDSRNLNVRDLSVTHETGNMSIINGANAFSLVHSNDNIHIGHCCVYNMPYVEGSTYPDGGKAFTIQAGPNTSQRNLTINDNVAWNVSYGCDYTKTSYSEGDKLENIVFEKNTINDAIIGVVIHEWDSPFGENVNPVFVRYNTIANCQIGVLCQTTKACAISKNIIKNLKRPDRLLYYKGVYGIHTLGAYNTIIESNQIDLNDCDAFMNVNVYSYYPRFNGAVRNMTVRNNIMQGTSHDTPVRVGKEAMTISESKMLEDIQIFDNTVLQTK